MSVCFGRLSVFATSVIIDLSRCKVEVEDRMRDFLKYFDDGWE